MASHSDDEAAIRELIASWMRASMAGDSRAVLDLMADDVVFLVPGQPTMTKEAFAAGQQSLANVDLKGSAEVREVKVFGDWAYSWTQLTVEMTPPGGRAIKRTGPALSIFKKQDGRWMLFRDANMLAPVPDTSAPSGNTSTV